MNEKCIFCRIAADELPASRIYEDRDLLAFMDIGPLVKGHVLVIPRNHYEGIHDSPPRLLQSLIVTAQRIAKAQLQCLNAEGVNITQSTGAAAGQVVPHIHFHVVPRFADDGKPISWRPTQYDSNDEMNTVADRLRETLSAPAPDTETG